VPFGVVAGDPSRSVHAARDGSAIAYVDRGEDGKFGVWIRSPVTGAARRYEPAPFASDTVVQQPFLRFSPDGRQLLLIWTANAGTETWLLPYPPDPASAPRRVLEGLVLAGNTPEFSWLPDNRHVVIATFSDQPWLRQLNLADLRSGAVRVLTPGSATSQLFPAVSPDGTKLVFVEQVLDYDVVSLDLRTGAVSPLIATARSEQMAAWAAKTDALVYVSDRNGTRDLWLHEPGRAARPIVAASDFPANSTQWLMGPALAPDATRVIYGRIERATSGSRLWISAVAGGSPVPLTSAPGFEWPGSWSPDANWYAYGHVEAGLTLKKVRTSGQAEPVTLAANLSRVTLAAPVWSPDGAWILYEDAGLKLISADGATTRDLRIADAVCTFARNGEALYCLQDLRAPGAQLQLFTVNLLGEERRVIGSVARAYAPAVLLAQGMRLTLAPDGNSLTYSIGKFVDNLWLLGGLDTVPLP
jgi:Tol biopolymer transport system component